jgi:hypothetical protein
MAPVDLGKLITEIFRGTRAAAGRDVVTLLTSELGGARIPFRGLRDLERGVSAIGEELHTEYLLSYTPDHGDAGYHHIRVQVDRPNAVVRSRPDNYAVQ